MTAAQVLTPELMLSAYASGIFPMAEDRASAELFWVDPRRRGIIPLDGFHISRSLRRRMLKGGYEIAVNRDFTATVAACADRPETWINAELESLYAALHARGFAHSLEVWQEGRLVGGVFGIALGGAFFGESMFSRVTDASKIALAYLVDRLGRAGFTLFDTQFLTEHLASLGGIEISRAEYRRRLAEALTVEADFTAPEPIPAPQEVVQRITQTS
ncbi:leucyl/phenylalanyl-tRNA--protein transferase [Meinhardsimonia xiamenensis]|jgi:leucyl/phenylalanyl-tRNA--protein transferase|uniref:Leucyl/phenylalanyl-tRNA--protein transferase n=1 Tax=Meinhardsimonia xiamenensis TaxID=990712 RepID=A0A1G9GCL2_9RHOB|nr:leucyl/phenylalanyl-tRNA--protein transferase [Meinhardsimonia xiamenensis]PRX31960.1 leucyl/phenylalanyl-tRNA--protein transferase [Meinhardsimonia xiamenensis]SDK98448.1 leucyl/phenylalanyl-tRNA--protein transferase [Meinhardsimonia xiamenensis]